MDAWRSRHRSITILLCVHSVAIPAYGAIRGYALGHVALESLVVPLAAVVANLDGLSRRNQTLIASLGLLTCSAILVHLSGGLIEMHFHYFVVIVVISLYQDWLPFTAAIAYVLIHHGLAGAIDPTSVFNHPAAINRPWLWGGVHAAFIAGIVAACLANWRVNERHLQEAGIAEQQLTAEIRLVERVNEVGAALVADLDPLGVVRRTVDLATELSSAAAGLFFYEAPTEIDQGRLQYVRSGRAETLDAPPGIRANAMLASAFRQGQVAHVADATAGSGADEGRAELESLMDGMTIRSHLAVPVVSRSATVGVLVLFATQPNQLGAASARAALGVANHAAGALENARLYVAQRAAAATLQQSLLPARLPTVPGLSLAARYLAGGPDCDVGGDWYDVFRLPDGALGLAMGDVVGRGLGAASLMGQLRNALRAYALEGYSPARTLDRLNDMACTLGLGYVATVVFVALDPMTGRARMANAGHLPLLLVNGDGTSEFIRCEAGIPLGVLDDPQYAEAAFDLPCGSALAMYTDGLVEDRLTSLDEGSDRLRRAVLGHRTANPEDMCAQMLEHRTSDAASEDDTALLIVRRNEPEAPAVNQRVARRDITV